MLQSFQACNRARSAIHHTLEDRLASTLMESTLGPVVCVAAVGARNDRLANVLDRHLQTLRALES
jgi:hypothetical protein